MTVALPHAEGPDRRRAVVEALARVVGADLIATFGIRCADGAQWYTELVAIGDPAATRVWDPSRAPRHHGPWNPTSPGRAADRFATGLEGPLEARMLAGELPVWNHFYRPAGLRWQRRALIYDGGRFVGWLGAVRMEDRPDFGPREERALARALPGLSAALRADARLRDLSAPDVGPTVLVTPDGRPEWATAGSERGPPRARGSARRPRSAIEPSTPPCLASGAESRGRRSTDRRRAMHAGMHDSRAAFRHPAFVRFQLGRILTTVGIQMVSVAVGWQVYALTGRALDLGLVGLVQFLPHLMLFPVTGLVVDRADRKGILVACYLALTLGVSALACGAHLRIPVGGIYALLFSLAIARAFVAPASSALLPQTVPPELFTNAVTWSSMSWALAAVAGPALGGGVYALTGSAAAVYLVSAVCLGAAALMAAGIRPRPVERRAAGSGLGDLLAGLRFIWGRPILLGGITLDVFAVLFGGAVALLPIYARDILHTGPEGLGLLRAAPSIGAALTSLVLSYRPIARHAGRKLLVAVAVFGLATVAFSLSRTLWACFLALLVAGLADQVSVVIRRTLTVLSTPDHLRGRVGAAEFVFVGVSNEVGELESGLAAQWLGPVTAALSGGIGSLVVVLAVTIFARQLREVDRLTPEALNTP